MVDNAHKRTGVGDWRDFFSFTFGAISPSAVLQQKILLFQEQLPAALISRPRSSLGLLWLFAPFSLTKKLPRSELFLAFSTENLALLDFADLLRQHDKL